LVRPQPCQGQRDTQLQRLRLVETGLEGLETLLGLLHWHPRHGLKARHGEVMINCLGPRAALTPKGQRMTMEHHMDWSSSPGHVPVNRQKHYLEQHRLWQARWMALWY
jgi:hypothetical protein